MNIGINLLFLKPGIAGGTETYTYGLLKGLKENNKASNHTFYIFCSDKLVLDFLKETDNFKIVRYKKIAKSVRSRVLFEQFLFPYKIKKYKLDVLHSLGYTGPVFQKDHLVTIHDTNAFVHEDMPSLKKKLLSFFLVSVAKNCDHILTVSNFSKHEIGHYLKVPESKVTVIYEASKFDTNTATESLSAEYSYLKNSLYFIALSSVTKNKNIITLLKAFKKISIKYPELKLVLAGYMPPDNSIAAFIQEQNMASQIVVTGFIDDSLLTSLFKNSYCYIFPSLYEGFGLPLLEAQTLGVPVICSNMGSLPEVGADSVMYFEGKNDEALAERMEEIITDKNKRSELIDKGYKNILRFNWNKTAEQTMNIYQNYNTKKNT